MKAEFFNPVRSLCAPGSLERLPEVLGSRRCALVVFPEARAMGLLARLEVLLRGRLACVIEDVRPNPDVAELRGLWTNFWRVHADVEVIVAVGGGSVIDTAKALAVAPGERCFDRFLAALETGRPWQPGHVRPLIAVPTTAGTGSEVTPWATIWDRSGGRKLSLHLEQTWPHVAIIDADLMQSLPRPVTLQSGLDALSHALESIWNLNANPVSDTFAVSAVRDILGTLPALLEAPSERELRAGMARAALKAGLAFSNTKTALAHSISYEMTLRHGLPHGIACSFVLPMVLERASGCDAGRDQVLAQALGVPLERGPALLRRFLGDLGVATEFSAYGVGAAEVDMILARAAAGVRGANFIACQGAQV